MPERGDAYFPEVVGCQCGQEFGIDVILAECRLVSFKTERSQPVGDVHCRSLAQSDRWQSIMRSALICPAGNIEEPWLIEHRVPGLIFAALRVHCEFQI